MADPEASHMLNAPPRQMKRDDVVSYIKTFDQRSRLLLALGPLLRGTLWETIAVPELRAQAKRVAETLLEQPPAPVDEAEVMMEYMI